MNNEVNVTYIKRKGILEYMLMIVSFISVPILFASSIGGGRFVEYSQNSIIYDLPIYLRVISFLVFLFMVVVFLGVFTHIRKAQVTFYDTEIVWNDKKIQFEEIKIFKISSLPDRGEPMLLFKFIKTNSKSFTFKLIGDKTQKDMIIDLLGKEKFSYGLI
ncbi:MAG: hypothetical protein ABJG47_12915 [Ekhidna sp.]